MIIDTDKGKMPVRYGMNAIADFADLTNKTMNDVMGLDLLGMRPSEVLTFIYIGFKWGARKAGEECKVGSIEEVGDMIDDDSTLSAKVFAVYNDSSGGEGDGKKK